MTPTAIATSPPLPATCPLEQLLDGMDYYGDAPSRFWADDSPKPQEIVAAEWQVERLNRAQCQLQTEEDSGLGDGEAAEMLRSYLAGFAEEEIAMRVLETTEDQRVAEARAEAEANPSPEAEQYAKYVEYWRDDKFKRRHIDTTPIATAPQKVAPPSGSHAKARGGKTSSASRDRSSDSSDSDGGGGNGPGEAGQTTGKVCACKGCANLAFSNQAKYCREGECKKARQRQRQDKCRANQGRPPKGEYYVPGGDLRKGMGEASILVSESYAVPESVIVRWDDGKNAYSIVKFAQPPGRRKPSKSPLELQADRWIAGELEEAA